MNKLYLLTVCCLLASIAIGAEGFARGKTSSRQPVESAISQSTQEEDSDSSDNVKGFERPDDSSGSLGVPSEEAEAALVGAEGHPAPEPYSFAYSADTEDGSSSTREETGDKDGKITGFYMLAMADGSQRRVNYMADKTGFHATITTNEVGTESRNPADVTIESSAPEVVYPEGPQSTQGGSASSGSRISSASGSRSNSISSNTIAKNVDESSSDDEDDFGSASSASGSSSKGAAAPRPAAKRPVLDAQQEETEDEVEAPAAPAPAPRPQPAARPAPQPTKTAPRPAPASRPQPQPAPRPAPRPAPQPTKTAPRPAPAPRPQPQPAPRPAPRPAPQPTKTAPRPAPASRPQPQPAPRPAPRPAPQPTKTAPRPAPAPRPQPAPRPAPRPAPTKGGSKSVPVAPSRPAPVQRRPAPRPAPPVKTSQETNTDDEESFGNENEQSADSSNSQYMVFPLNGVNAPEIANLVNNRRPIVAANRNTGLWLNENQLRNLLAVSRYRS